MKPLLLAFTPAMLLLVVAALFAPSPSKLAVRPEPVSMSVGPPLLIEFVPTPTTSPPVLIDLSPTVWDVPVLDVENDFGYDDVQQAIFDRFEPHGVGHLFVRISYFEGYNPASRWDPYYVSGSGDACALQINQVHDDTSTSLLWELFGEPWPGPLVTDLDACLEAGEALFLRDGHEDPWKNSRVRPDGQGWGAIDPNTGKLVPIYNPAGEIVGLERTAK